MSWGFKVGTALKPECGWKLSPTQRDEAARRYSEGERVTDLAKEFGVSKPNIIHLVKSRKLARTKRTSKHDTGVTRHRGCSTCGDSKYGQDGGKGHTGGDGD